MPEKPRNVTTKANRAANETDRRPLEMSFARGPPRHGAEDVFRNEAQDTQGHFRWSIVPGFRAPHPRSLEGLAPAPVRFFPPDDPPAPICIVAIKQHDQRLRVPVMSHILWSIGGPGIFGLRVESPRILAPGPNNPGGFFSNPDNPGLRDRARACIPPRRPSYGQTNRL